MTVVTEPARAVDVIHRTDVLVVGSGPGGLAAAIGAARAGVEVTLVERFGCFGGNITAVGVEGFAWYRHEATIDSEGVGREFEDRARAMGAAVPEGDAIIGVITESKAGREAILAKRVIDASGDADIAHRAGAKTFKTPKEEMMAASVMFSMTGVDKRRFVQSVAEDPQTYRDWDSGEWSVETSGKEDALFSPFLRKPFDAARAEGLIPADLVTIAGTWGAAYDAGDLTYLNLVHLAECDGTDPDDLTRFEIEGRRQAMMAVEAMRRHQPGCEGAKLRNFGMTLGVRDTRKIDADYNMTVEDVRHQGRFEDSVGIFPEFIDGYGLLILPTTGRYFQVPYRTMLPKGVEGLLVAGRATGGDKISHAATRNMMCCTVTGQGAGVAAAVSVRGNAPLDRLNLAAVRSELARQDVRLH